MPMPPGIPGTFLPGSPLDSALPGHYVLLITLEMLGPLQGLCTWIHAHRRRAVPGTLRAVRV